MSYPNIFETIHKSIDISLEGAFENLILDLCSPHINWSDNFLKFSKEKNGWALPDRILNFALTQPPEIQNKIFSPLSFIYFSSRGGDMVEKIALERREGTEKERVVFSKNSSFWLDKGLTHLLNTRFEEQIKFSNQLIEVILKMDQSDPFLKEVENTLIKNTLNIFRFKYPIQNLQHLLLQIAQKSSDRVFIEVFKGFFAREEKKDVIYKTCKELFDVRDQKSASYRTSLGEIEIDLLDGLARFAHLEYEMEEIYKKSKAKLNFINSERIKSPQNNGVGVQLAHLGLAIYAATFEHSHKEYNVSKMKKLCEQTFLGLKDEEIKSALQGGVSNHPMYEKFCLEKLNPPMKIKGNRKTL